MLYLSLWLCNVAAIMRYIWLCAFCLRLLWLSVVFVSSLILGCFSSSVNNAFGILLRIAVTVRINFGSYSHFTMLILLVQEHGSSSSDVPCLPRALRDIRLFTGAPGFLHLNTFPHRTALAGSQGFWWVVLWHSFDSESFTQLPPWFFLRWDLFH